MLSILIPIYNFNVTALVEDLHRQSTECRIQFEILCLDDASLDFFKNQNKGINALSNVTYTELSNNIGRSKIRNQLAELSIYDNLLFLDCDAALPSQDFIKKYIIHIEDYHVVYGGRIYENYPPLSKQKYFRWYYGKKRESFNVQQRIKQPFKSFMTNNFLIRKKAFLSIRLNESIIGYGHEDTLFGIRLKENSVIVKHINNPVIHIGLEDFDEYFEKTLEGLRNLLFISHVVSLHDTVRLYKYLALVKKYKIERLVIMVGKGLERMILKNLQGNRPVLVLFDLYKIAHLSELDLEKE